jgi:hypothetical protein
VFRPVDYPFGNGAPRDAKQTFNAAQTEAFQHDPFHLSSRVLIIAPLSLQRAVAPAGFAVICLVTFVIMAVSHQVFAAAFRASMRYNRLYHEKVLQINLVVCPGYLFMPHQSKPHHYQNELAGNPVKKEHPTQSLVET